MAMRAIFASNGNITYQILLNVSKSSSGRLGDLLRLRVPGDQVLLHSNKAKHGEQRTATVPIYIH